METKDASTCAAVVPALADAPATVVSAMASAPTVDDAVLSPVGCTSRAAVAVAVVVDAQLKFNWFS